MKTVEKFSPSLLEHLAICPGYAPEPFGGTASDEGTLMHKAFETGDLSKLDEEQRLCVTKTDAAFKRAIHEYFNGQAVKIFREKWCAVEGINRGIMDILAIGKRKALVGDAKFGRREVTDAEFNLQGLCYVVAVLEEFPQVDEVQVRFAQPRCNSISFATFKREVYHTILLQIKAVKARVKQFSETQDASLLNPQDQNCAYCANIAECPRVATKALAIAKGYDLAHDAELPDLFHPSQLATPERRAQAEQLRRVLEKWCASVQKSNIEFRLQGEEIPGYELKERSGNRSITSPVTAWEVAQEICGHTLTEEDLASCSTISAAKLDDVVASKFPRGKKAKAKLQLEEALVDKDALSLGGTSHYLQRIKN